MTLVLLHATSTVTLYLIDSRTFHASIMYIQLYYVNYILTQFRSDLRGSIDLDLDLYTWASLIIYWFKIYEKEVP